MVTTGALHTKKAAPEAQGMIAAIVPAPHLRPRRVHRRTPPSPSAPNETRARVVRPTFSSRRDPEWVDPENAPAASALRPPVFLARQGRYNVASLPSPSFSHRGTIAWSRGFASP